MLPSTSSRVRENTAGKVNAAIREQTRMHVACFSAGGREAIDRRLAELEREWDIERTLETNASALALTGVVLGTTSHRAWLLLPALVAGFLLQHALQGWCPPVPLLRRLGFRTEREIDEERFALKALRGDFEGIPRDGQEAERVQKALAAAQC